MYSLKSPRGDFLNLNVGALLHDFQRAWNERMDVYFQNEEIDFTTAIAGRQSKELFKLTGCNSRKAIIEWLPLNEYLEHSTKTMTSS